MEINTPEIDYAFVFAGIIADPRYQENLDWGEPRRGHPEGTVRAHIADLEANLDRLQHRLHDRDSWKLKVLIHTHDTFKKDARPGVPIDDPRSHASLARAFLAEFCPDANLLAMVQYHDEPYALWRKVAGGGVCNRQRLEALQSAIHDWTLFLTFLLIDGCTAGKSRDPLVWFFATVDAPVEIQGMLAEFMA